MSTPNWHERPTVFECDGDRLIGIIAQPDQPIETGVVIIVGGPQYRAGSHRQFTLLARQLAAQGIASIRFDYRGMGDSEGEMRNFEAIDDPVRPRRREARLGIDPDVRLHLPSLSRSPFCARWPLIRDEARQTPNLAQGASGGKEAMNAKPQNTMCGTSKSEYSERNFSTTARLRFGSA